MGTAIHGEFPLQIRLESAPDHCVRMIRLEDLGEQPTYEALCNKAVELATGKAVEETDLGTFSIKLKWKWQGPGEPWLIDINSTNDLLVALNHYQELGVFQVSASVKSEKATVLPTISNANIISDLSSSPLDSPKKTVQKKISAPKKLKLSTKVRKDVPVDQRIVSSMQDMAAIGIEKPLRSLISMFSGYKNTKSAAFAAAIARLKLDGHIVTEKTTVSLTSKGKELIANSFNPPKNNEEIHQRIKKLLSPKGVEMFNILVDGCTHERKSLSLAMKYSNEKSAGFATALSRMKALNVVHSFKGKGGEKLFQLSDMAFPFGRPGGFPPKKESDH